MAEDDKRFGDGPRTRLKTQAANSVGKKSPDRISSQLVANYFLSVFPVLLYPAACCLGPEGSPASTISASVREIRSITEEF
jgi:hypothetical protein